MLIISGTSLKQHKGAIGENKVGAELSKKMQDKFDLTSIEVIDVMKCMRILVIHFEHLARSFSTECFVELKKFNLKKTAAKKAGGVNPFLSFTQRSILQSSNTKSLYHDFKQAKSSRELLVEALDAYKISGDHKRSITTILSLMAESGTLENEEAAVTGRHAFETLVEAGIE